MWRLHASASKRNARCSLFSMQRSILPHQSLIILLFQGLIYVATTNDALPDVLAITPPALHANLVFLQNGMLLPWLHRHNLVQNTQVLLYMSASDAGEVRDGKQTVVSGRHAAIICATLQEGGLHCREVGWPDYQSRMVVKLLWASVFWALSAALGGLPVGQIVQRYPHHVQSLVAELLPLATGYLSSFKGLDHRPPSLPGSQADHPNAAQQSSAHQDSSNATFSAADTECQDHNASVSISKSLSDIRKNASISYASNTDASTVHAAAPSVSSVVQQMCDYSMSIPTAVPSKKMALREFEWRNGFFLSQQVSPLHVDWLAKAGTPEHLLTRYRSSDISARNLT